MATATLLDEIKRNPLGCVERLAYADQLRETDPAAADRMRDTADIEFFLKKFVADCQGKINRYYAAHLAKLMPPTLTIDVLSDKWVRIVKTEEEGTGSSVYAFVCMEDRFTKTMGYVQVGDIHKAAGWKSAAKHARATVFKEETWDNVGPYGPAYL